MLDYLKIPAVVVTLSAFAFGMLGELLLGIFVGISMSVLGCIAFYNMNRKRDWVLIPTIVLPLCIVVGLVIVGDSDMNLAWGVSIGAAIGVLLSIIGVGLYSYLNDPYARGWAPVQ